MSKLSTVIRAFLGNTEEALSLVGDALHAAVVTMAQHGTRAPVDDAVQMLTALTGRTTKEKALRAGILEVSDTLKAINAGKATKEQAREHADTVAAHFVGAAAAVLAAPKVKYDTNPADVAAKAGKAFAKLSDAQVSAFLRTQAGADLLTRLSCIKAAADAVDAGREAARKEAAKPRTAAAPAAVVALPVPAAPAADTAPAAKEAIAA